MVILRVVDPSQAELCERLGQMVLASYLALPGFPREPDYERELLDVAARAAVSVVVGAFTPADGDGTAGTPVGCVTYVSDRHNAHAEFDDDDAASFRMLGIDPAAQRAGAGRALVSWCLDRARADGKAKVVIHSGAWMTGAHRLYAELGFRRDRARDWTPAPGIELLGFMLPL